MSITKNSISAVGLVFSLLAVSMFASFPGSAHANPSKFAPTKETAAATTTLAYMSPGAATTTISYDSLDGDSVKIDELTIGFQYTASATAPTLNVRLEDSRNGIDWYPRAREVFPVLPGITATTTLMTTPFNSLSFVLSTTTDNGGSGTFARIHESFTVKAPMRYVRAVFFVPTGGGNGGLWAQFMPVKEDPE